MKILVVDDDLHIQKLYKEELEEEGYEVVIAESGNYLLRKILTLSLLIS